MKILTLALILLPFTLVAQNSLSGKISNTSEEPEFYCKLLLIKDSVVLQTVATDSTGNYLFEVPSPGEYKLTIKVPFKSIDTLVTIEGQTKFDLKVDDGKYLDDVEIIGKKPTVIRKVDRTIFNPANIPGLVGGNANDVIDFAPGVYINGDEIHLSNGSSAKVMLNDKLIPLTGAELISFIKSIPTEDIQYVEIIPVPPVKYAISSGGLINIRLVVGVTRKLSRGSITADIGQKFYTQQSYQANYAYRKNKFSLYSNLSVMISKSRYVGTKTIDFDTTAHWNEEYTTISRYNGLAAGLGLNYEFNRKTEIGVLYVADFYSSGLTNNSQIDTRNNSSLIASISNYSLDKSNNKKQSVNMNLTSKLDSTGKKIDINFDYTNFVNNGKAEYFTNTITPIKDSNYSQTNRLVRSANLFSAGVDYVQPIKSVKINFGGRYSFTSNKYHLSVFNNLLNQGQEDTLKSNTFNYDEHIQAIYTSVDWKIKRWTFQVGFRGENTIYFGNSPTTGLEITNNYFQLVPKIFAMYETKGGKFWNINYSREFNRPSYNELNPFKYYTSNYQYRTGNPYLKPSVYHSIGISTTVKNFDVSLYSFYSTKDMSTVTIYDDATQLQQTTIANLFSSKGIFTYINYYKTFKKRLSFDINFLLSFSNTVVKQVITPQNLNVLTGSIDVGMKYTLDKKETFFLSLNGSYRSPFFQQITYQVEAPYTRMTLRKILLHNQMNILFSFNDPFRLMKLKSTTKSNSTTVRDNNYFDTQAIYLSITFKLGNNNIKINQHSTNSTGEAGRIGK